MSGALRDLQLGVERNKMRRRIQEVLDAQGMNFARLAAHIGVTKPAVYRTVNGQIHSPRVLQALRDFGVPEQYLFDPKNYPTPAPAPVVKRRVDAPAAEAV